MKHVIIALDFDGCMASPEKSKIKHTKRMYNKEVKPTDLAIDIYPLGNEKYIKLTKYVMSEGIMEFELLPNVKEVLDKLYEKGFRFSVVTARMQNSEHQELSACKKYCKHHQLPIEDFYNTNEQPKDDICNKIGAAAIIDDTLDKLIPLKKTNMKLFYLQQPWNSHKKNKDQRIINVNHWNDFYDILLETFQKNN